jgi:ATP-binding cassette subfamily B protein
MGFFSGLETEAYDRTYGDSELVRRVAGYFRPHLVRLALASIGVLIVALSGAATPVLISQGVDLISENAHSELFLLPTVALFALGVLTWVANWLGRRTISRTVGDVMLQLRRDAFSAAVEHDLSFYDEFSSGKVVSRVSSDTEDFARVVVLITDVGAQLLQAALLLGYLSQINTRLTLWLVGMLPVILGVAVSFRRLARKVTRQGFRAMANVNAAIKEAVTGIAIAKNFRQESTIYGEFDEVNLQSYRINVRRGFVLATVFPSLEVLGGVGTALLVYLGGLSVGEGLISVGAWYLFINSLNRFWFPMLNLSAFWTQIQNGLSAAERVFALIDAEPAVQQSERRPVPPLRGEIRFQDVCFRYVPGEPVLKDFDLRIPPGETLALVGHTGAGKSSIARLITRFYEFQSGEILIDGMDIRSMDLNAYRKQLGVVPQSPFLFSGTVAENICYGGQGIDLGEIRALADRIGGGEWVETLPNGLETVVGERGGRLSMGQRQLVALMRVLVQKPAIFILDEATASIDPFTEEQIQEAISLILAEATSVLIAHRLSTVRAADRIIVLKQGSIIEEGTHDALMGSGGHYAELYNTYFRHQSLGYVEKARSFVGEG